MGRQAPGPRVSGPQERELCPVTGSFAAAERTVMSTSQLPSGSAMIRTAPPPPGTKSSVCVPSVGAAAYARACV